MADEITITSDVPEIKSNDDDLDKLLDNALEDFDIHVQLPTGTLDGSTKTKTESTSDSDGSKKPLPKKFGELMPDLLDEDAVKNLMNQFEQTFQSLLTEGGDEGVAEFSQQFSNDFKKLAEDTVKELKEESGSSESEFAATISETLKNLSENADSLQGNGNDILNMLGALGLEGGEGGGEGMPTDFSSMFNNIMQMFLSKDILYPSLKELVTKYPDWLEDNKSSLSKDDYTRYLKQLEIMKKVCFEMESATDGDNDEVKSKRFSIILGLMQQMQDYGHPPKSLMGDSFDIPNWM